jgi:prepilin-type N-terminal cleavage/methylation domain-containing protein
MALVEKDLQKRIELVFGMIDNKDGFSLIELMMVLVIVAIIGAITAPYLQQTSPRYERETFIARFNTLLRYGWQQALITHKIHRINVDIGKKTITLTVESEGKDKSGESIFVTIANPVEDTVISIPDHLNIKQFFIEGFDMMTKFARSKTASVWFYIMPEGMVQNVVINVVDTKEIRDNIAQAVGLVINPFSGQLRVYDSFQKP